MTTILKKLFHTVTGETPQETIKLTGDGSNRHYYRMKSGDTTLIGTKGISVEENSAFFALSAHLAVQGINVPIVHAISPDKLSYLQSDLGDTTLYDRLEPARKVGTFNEQQCDDLCKVMAQLPDIQYLGAKDFDFSVCYPVPAFDRRSIFWDFNYFKYSFLKAIGIEFNEAPLEDEFEKLSQILLSDNENTFMFRDFQSRNIMWHNDQPHYIDFQGGRRGPIYYDVASFVWQARARYTPEAVDKMIDAYLDTDFEQPADCDAAASMVTVN
ncbi:MAG: phosphotransferase, partial [Bacteroidaceae bacterium]|nr:phosphotransferase [Bacteroidaceae bacterium]